MSSTPLPPGYHKPLALSDANHHGGWVVICNAFGLTAGLIAVAIRIYLRAKVNPPFSRDDWTVGVATALSVVQAALVFAAVHYGFGTAQNLISNKNLIEVQKYVYGADVFFILALYCNKCSVVLLYNRIAPDRAHTRAAWVVLSGCVAFGVISLFLVALRCHLNHPWLQYNAYCSNLYPRWAAVFALNVFSEVAVFALSIHLVWGLQTSFVRKWRVLLAFALRLPVILIAAFRIYYIGRNRISPDATLTGAIVAVMTQLEIFYSLTSATIPCLRPFLTGLVTNYGAMGTGTVIGGSEVGTSSNDRKATKGSFLTSFTSRDHEMSPRRRELSFLRSKNRDRDDVLFAPDGGRSQVEITHTAVSKSPSNRHDTLSIGSNESTKMIIKKEVEVQIDRASNTFTKSDQRRGLGIDFGGERSN